VVCFDFAHPTKSRKLIRVNVARKVVLAINK
jgi:hypothetical protein